MLLNIFSKRLADSMELNGKKQIDVVRDLGIPRSAMSQYLSGKFEPKKDRIYQLSEYFGVTPEWLMGYTNDPQGHVMLDDNMYGSQDEPAEYDPQIEYLSAEQAGMGKRIASIRRQRKLSVAEVAKRGGISGYKIRQIESGKDYTNADIQKIADGMGVDIEMIWRWDQKQLVRYTSDEDTFFITEKEILFVQAYREHEQVQGVIDKILDLPSDVGKGVRAAKVGKK